MIVLYVLKISLIDLIIALLVDLVDEVILELALQLVSAHQMLKFVLIVMMHRILVLFV